MVLAKLPGEGRRAVVKVCEHLPVFRGIKDPTAANGLPVYQHDGKFYVSAGTTQGCGGVYSGPFCTNCRSWMPTLMEIPGIRTAAAVSKRKEAQRDRDAR